MEECANISWPGTLSTVFYAMPEQCFGLVAQLRGQDDRTARQHKVITWRSCVRRSSSEIAGLGPDANLLRFAKQHVAAQWVHPLIGSSVFSLSAEAGVVLPWGPGWQAKPTYISERQASNRSPAHVAMAECSDSTWFARSKTLLKPTLQHNAWP